MVANYPTIVRKFTPHVDGTEYVMAAHMNDAQDEITAVESTLGVKPHVYTPTSGTPTTYTTVGSRLDVMQRTLDTQAALINQLLAASQTGWSLPIASIVASGTSIPPTGNYEAVVPSDWYALRWTAQNTDTNGVFSPGYNLTIPQAGWWVITSTVGMLDPSSANNVEHVLFGRIRANSAQPGTQYVGMVDLGQGDSSASGEAGGYHRITMATAANFNAGDTLQVQLRHVFLPLTLGQPAPPSNNLTASSRTQLTYIRGLPGITNWGTVQLPYEIGT